MRLYRIIPLLFSFLYFGWTPAFAITQDGAIGASSIGTTDVSMTINEKFKISDLKPIEFNTWDGVNDLTSDVDVCVYHNGDGTYKATINDSSTLSDGFAVQDQSNTNAIPIIISVNDGTGTTGGLEVNKGIATPTHTGANTSSENCEGMGSMNIQVTINNTQLQQAPAGDYSTELVIMVEPD